MTTTTYGAEYVATDLPDVDDILGGGLIRDGLTLLVGTAKSGKTALAMTIAAAVSRRGESVAFFSTEMAEWMLLKRAVAIETGISLAVLGDGRLENEERQAITDVQETIKARNWRFMAHPKLDMYDVRHTVEGVHEDAPLSLIVADGFLWPTMGTDSEDSHPEARILFDLKALARDFHLPVIATKYSRKATGADVVGSSLAESIADVALRIRRDGDPQDMLNRNMVDLDITANRHGECGTIPLFWRPDTCRLTCLARGASLHGEMGA